MLCILTSIAMQLHRETVRRMCVYAVSMSSLRNLWLLISSPDMDACVMVFYASSFRVSGGGTSSARTCWGCRHPVSGIRSLLVARLTSVVLHSALLLLSFTWCSLSIFSLQDAHRTVQLAVRHLQNPLDMNVHVELHSSLIPQVTTNPPT